jgi:uncharacterized RDD family membrane protein YckC
VSPPRYEGLVTRAIAFAIDAAAINVVGFAVGGIVALAVSVLSLPDALDGVLLAVGGVLFVAWSIGYFVVFWSTTGQTPGSRAMRIRLCRAGDGAVVKPRVAVIRVVYLVLAALPLFAGFLTILVDDRRRGVNDMLAGTVVVEAVEIAEVISADVAPPPPATPARGRTRLPVTDGSRPRSASASRST